MASALLTGTPHLPAAESWAAGLGGVFARVALFEIDRSKARVAAVRGVSHAVLGRSVSLAQPSPLRWCIEAASPVISSGRSPSGLALARLLGLSAPRAFAVLPLVVRDRLIALAYADNEDQPLRLAAVGELLSHCAALLEERAELAPEPPRAPVRSTAHRQRRRRTPGLLPCPPRSADPIDDIDLLARRIAAAPLEELELFAAEAPPEPLLAKAAPDSSGADFAPAPTTATSVLALDAAAPHAAGQPNADALAPEHTRLEQHIESETLPALALVADAAPAAPLLPPLATTAPEPLTRLEPPPARPRRPARSDGTRPITVRPYPPPRAERTVRTASETLPAGLPAHAGEVFASVPAAELVVTPQGVMPANLLGKTKRRRRASWWLAAPLTVLATAVLGLALVAPRLTDKSARFEIAPNATVAEIARDLKAHGLIRNPLAFRVLARLSGGDRRLRAGAHTISPGAWAWTVLHDLEHSDVDMLTVTVPEGLGLAEVAQLLEEHGVSNRETFVRAASDRRLLQRYGISADTAEGFLFPETYTFARGLAAREVVEIMLEQFFARWRDLPGARDLAPEAMLERVILASIVQREARIDDEMQRIAGVFANRLDQNMRLESCATVQYILGKPKARLRLADLRLQSPFNTYLNEGLPPGPIANPGQPALLAALQPEKHDFLFFVSRDDGSGLHVFTRSFTAHQAVARRVQAN